MAQSLKVLCTEQKLEEIAEAIREKKGVSVKYTLDESAPQCWAYRKSHAPALRFRYTCFPCSGR